MEQNNAAPDIPKTRLSRRANHPVRRDDEGGRDSRQNLGRNERVVSMAGGGLLAAYALKHRGATGVAIALVGGALMLRGATGYCRVYDALGVSPRAERGRRWLVQQRGPSAVLDGRRAERMVHTVTIGRPRADLYAYWRDMENLPRIMRNLESVKVVNRKRSRWMARGPAGRMVEWDALINNEVLNEVIGWKSVPGAAVPNAGSVRFTDSPDGLGTVLQVTIEYAPPGGAMGSAVARLFGDDPARQVSEDLETFKQNLEARPGAAEPLARRGTESASRAD